MTEASRREGMSLTHRPDARCVKRESWPASGGCRFTAAACVGPVVDERVGSEQSLDVGPRSSLAQAFPPLCGDELAVAVFGFIPGQTDVPRGGGSHSQGRNEDCGRHQSGFPMNCMRRGSHAPWSPLPWKFGSWGRFIRRRNSLTGFHATPEQLPLPTFVGDHWIVPGSSTTERVRA